MSKTGKQTVVSFCATFLPPEMLHVYRQVCGVKDFNLVVISRTRQHPELFPFEQLHLLTKSPWRFFSRMYHKLRGERIPMSHYETRQMRDLVARQGASLIHIYLGTEAVRVLPYLRQETRPKIVSFHGADLSQSLKTAEFQQLLAHTNLFLVRSESLRAALLERGCPPERIRLNRTGVPLPISCNHRVLGAVSTTHPLRLLQACRFVNKKGLDVTIQALALLTKWNIPVVLDLSGSGPQEKALRLLARELNLEERIRFLGFIDNPKLLRQLSNYDVFVHPSRMTDSGDREGIPNSLLEAMAVGIPTVSTRHSGIPEVVQHGKNGVLIDHCDAELLAKAIQELAVNSELYAHISQAGYATIKNQYSIAKCIESLEGSYRYAMGVSE